MDTSRDSLVALITACALKQGMGLNVDDEVISILSVCRSTDMNLIKTLCVAQGLYNPDNPAMARYFPDQVKERHFYGLTEEEAQTAASQSGIAREKIKEIKVTRLLKDDSATAKGKEASAAFESAKKKVPSEAFEISKPELVQSGDQGSVEILDETEAGARKQCITKVPKNASIDGITCTTPPKAGFLGIGKKLGVYVVKWSIPFCARITYKLPVRVSVSYKE
jgi:hypothetical protein